MSCCPQNSLGEVLEAWCVGPIAHTSTELSVTPFFISLKIWLSDYNLMQVLSNGQSLFDDENVQG